MRSPLLLCVTDDMSYEHEKKTGFKIANLPANNDTIFNFSFYTQHACPSNKDFTFICCLWHLPLFYFDFCFIQFYNLTFHHNIFFLQNLFDVINQHEMQGSLSMPSSNVLVLKRRSKKVFNSHFK